MTAVQLLLALLSIELAIAIAVLTSILEAVKKP